MEDETLIDKKFQNGSSLFAVFDGHGTGDVSQFCREQFSGTFKSQIALYQNIETALAESFKLIDEFLRTIKDCDDKIIADNSGSTASVVYID